MKHRTFIAVSAPPEIRQVARRVMDLLSPAAREVKWVAAENLHWTLHFLGEIDVLEVPALCAAVSQAAREVETFELEVHGAGAFPAPDRPRTLWLGAGAGSQSMIALQAAIQHKLDRLGYRGESRRYVPHLTLGRAGKNAPVRPLVRELAGLADFRGGAMLVDEVTVYSSRLGPDGPAYEVLAHAPLSE